ncbi:hypothetical protein BDW42DRAFT_93937 [Aspergillus taichungensis]|uniref:Uncharacterized protein n=1 Tax=Aspergillus taichungensis TaxID=482145 RepID=A0A2J5I965_9EURO|nr:hypothetical protein BDW42DRAFT_93937 [Aspergillus taichungensis]
MDCGHDYGAWVGDAVDFAAFLFVLCVYASEMSFMICIDICRTIHTFLFDGDFCGVLSCIRYWLRLGIIILNLPSRSVQVFSSAIYIRLRHIKRAVLYSHLTMECHNYVSF